MPCFALIGKGESCSVQEPAKVSFLVEIDMFADRAEVVDKTAHHIIIDIFKVA